MDTSDESSQTEAFLRQAPVAVVSDVLPCGASRYSVPAAGYRLRQLRWISGTCNSSKRDTRPSARSRRYRAAEPEHRWVVRSLERDRVKALGRLAAAEAELTLREQQQPHTLTETEREQLLILSGDLGRLRAAPTISGRDRKQLLRCLIEEVILDVDRERERANVTIRWRGGAISEPAAALPRHQPTIRTDEDTIALLDRIAAHSDGKIAVILNRQRCRSAAGERFIAITSAGYAPPHPLSAY